MSEDSLNEGHRFRLRRRYGKVGADGFHDYELLELLLTYAIPRKDVKPIAKQLIIKFGSLSNVVGASIPELCSVDGIGEKSAILLNMIRPLFHMYYIHFLERTEMAMESDKMIEYIQMKYDKVENEECTIILFNSAGRLLETKTFTGNKEGVFVDVRQMVVYATSRKTGYLTLVHNHPHGPLEFSDEDIVLTRNIEKALALFNIKLHDHILISDGEILRWRDLF
ncbi:MAG: RadC family protein [Lentisphaeria bacterium]|nr:RadC family protein [Lentisphaeria bacterium]